MHAKNERKKRVRIPERAMRPDARAHLSGMSFADGSHSSESGKGVSPMAETPNETMQEAADLAAAARDRGIEHLEGAKGQLAEGAERVAAAVERTANELEGDGDDAISGFGRSVASLMRQLAGGLRERDVEAFAHELGALARRNPGVFLAGSVALGFGIARFFKARGPQSPASYDDDWQSERGWQSASEHGRSRRDEVNSEEDLDLSENATARDGEPSPTPETRTSESEAEERTQGKSRQSGKQKVKTQRASSGGAHQRSAGEESSAPQNERPSTDTSSGTTAGSKDSAFTDTKGGSAPRGGKE